MKARLIKNLLFAMAFAAVPLWAAEEDSASLAALRAAAQQGQADAQYELGILYEFGYNFPDHAIDAYVWYSRAADQGNAAAAKRRDLLKAQLSPAELQRAQREAQTPASTSSH
jgi:TPR repeat protein